MGTHNIWQGEKVRLRGLEPDDCETMYRWRMDSDAIGRVDYLTLPRSFGQFRREMEERMGRKPEGDDGSFAIENLDGELVGEAGVFGCNRRMGTFRYGLFIARDYWGRGYGKDALRLILRFYFLELEAGQPQSLRGQGGMPAPALPPSRRAKYCP